MKDVSSQKDDICFIEKRRADTCFVLLFFYHVGTKRYTSSVEMYFPYLDIIHWILKLHCYNVFILLH